MAFIATVEHLPIIRKKSHRGLPPTIIVDPVEPPKIDPEPSVCRRIISYRIIAGVKEVGYTTHCHRESRSEGTLVTGHGGSSSTRRMVHPEENTPRDDTRYEMTRMVD